VSCYFFNRLLFIFALVYYLQTLTAQGGAMSQYYQPYQNEKGCRLDDDTDFWNQTVEDKSKRLQSRRWKILRGSKDY